MADATSSPADDQWRRARRDALRATHPDLGGDPEQFIAAVRSFERVTATPAVAASAGGAGVATPPQAPGRPRPTIVTTRRSRGTRRIRRARRRLAAAARTRGRRWPLHHYAHLLEESP